MKNYGRIYSFLNSSFPKDQIEEAKNRYVSQYTNGRTTHLHDMADDEYEYMCDDIYEKAGSARKEALVEKRRKKRSICLRAMQNIGINTADWPHVNAFCMDTRIAGKPFGQLSIEELESLHRKLAAIYQAGGLKTKDRPTTTIITTVKAES
jgi:hypothetical protein